MSGRLDRLARDARTRDVAWDEARSARVLGGALRTRQSRMRRDRALRRGLAVAGGAAFVVLFLMRSASSREMGQPAQPEAIVARIDGDGGYSRD
jgi:hypothetical protein